MCVLLCCCHAPCHAGYWNWQGLVSVLISAGLGALVGEGDVSSWCAYMLAIGLSLAAIWPGLVGMGERPGCWAPEPFPPESATDLVRIGWKAGGVPCERAVSLHVCELLLLVIHLCHAYSCQEILRTETARQGAREPVIDCCLGSAPMVMRPMG
eukprot:COSAG01_NODE_5670_length_4108_cov_15.236219_2_plen_154_part_00